MKNLSIFRETDWQIYRSFVKRETVNFRVQSWDDFRSACANFWIASDFQRLDRTGDDTFVHLRSVPSEGKLDFSRDSRSSRRRRVFDGVLWFLRVAFALPVPGSRIYEAFTGLIPDLAGAPELKSQDLRVTLSDLREFVSLRGGNPWIIRRSHTSTQDSSERSELVWRRLSGTRDVKSRTATRELAISLPTRKLKTYTSLARKAGMDRAAGQNRFAV